MQDPIATRVIELVAESARVSPEQVTPESTFEELGLDSLNAMAMIADVEDEYGISIANEEALAMRRVGDAVDCTRRLLAEAGG